MHRILAADFGGQQKLRWVIAEDGDYLTPEIETTEINKPEDLYLFLKNMAEGVEAIGMSCAGTIDEKRNVVSSAPNLKWIEGVDLQSKAGIGLRLSNDIYAMAAGILTLMPGLNNFVAMTLGTGVGVKYVLDGKILGMDVEPGHDQLDPSPSAPMCGCGKRGCLEAFCGGNCAKGSLVQLAWAYGAEIDLSGDLWAQLDCAREREEKWACEFYRQYSYWLGRWFYNNRARLQISNYVLKGTMAVKAFDKYIKDGAINSFRNCGINSDRWVKELCFYMSPEPVRDAIIGAGKLAEEMCEF